MRCFSYFLLRLFVIWYAQNGMKVNEFFLDVVVGGFTSLLSLLPSFSSIQINFDR